MFQMPVLAKIKPLIVLWPVAGVSIWVEAVIIFQCSWVHNGPLYTISGAHGLAVFNFAPMIPWLSQILTVKWVDENRWEKLYVPLDNVDGLERELRSAAVCQNWISVKNLWNQYLSNCCRGTKNWVVNGIRGAVGFASVEPILISVGGFLENTFRKYSLIRILQLPFNLCPSQVLQVPGFGDVSFIQSVKWSTLLIIVKI